MTEIELNDTADAEVRDTTLPHLLMALYQRWQQLSDSTAIIGTGGNVISYRQLMREVECKYAALGLGKDVADLGGERAADMIISLLACWLHGMALTLRDDNPPPVRRGELLALSFRRLLVHQKDKSAEFPVTSSRCNGEVFGTPVPVIDNVLSDTAFIAFTSGSTGKPVATPGSLSGLAHSICWISQILNFSNDYRFVLLTVAGFNVIFRSALNHFLPAHNGGFLHIPSAMAMRC